MCKRLTDEGLAAVAAACPALERLDLGGCTRLTNDTLRVMSASRMRGSLRWLNLRSCWLITDGGVGFLTGNGTMVNTSRLDDDDNDNDVSANRALSTGMTALEELILQDCQEISDAALRMLQEGGGRHHIRPLRRLNLSFCANITDSGLRCVGRMAALESLNLRSCDNVSDLGLGYLAEASIGLQSLDVSFCPRISDVGLGHIAGGLFSLRHLAVMGCGRLSDEGLSKVAKTLLELETLAIGQCGRITDRSLELIGAHMKQLRRIDLYGCGRTTGFGILALAGQLPRLNCMNLGLLQQQK